MAVVVAITGVSRGLGAHLLSQVQCDPEVSRVVAIDEESPPPELLGDKVAFERRSPAQSWDDVFKAHGVQVAIHAGLSEPRADRAREEALNLGGTRRFLEACHAAGAVTVCFVSSSAAYGARPDNLDYLFEGAPLRATAAFPHAHDAARAELLCYEYAAKHPQVCLQIVRAAPVIGPTTRGFWTRLMERPVYLAPLGYEPVLQLVHEDDVTRAIWRLVRQQRVGVFNVAGDGYVTLTQLARLFGRRVVRLPVLLLRLVAWIAWRLGRSEVPPGFVDYLLHPWLINPTKLKAEAMFVFRYDTPRALLDWLEARDEVGGSRRGLVATPVEDDPEDLDEDDELFEEDEEEEQPGDATPVASAAPESVVTPASSAPADAVTPSAAPDEITAAPAVSVEVTAPADEVTTAPVPAEPAAGPPAPSALDPVPAPDSPPGTLLLDGDAPPPTVDEPPPAATPLADPIGS